MARKVNGSKAKKPDKVDLSKVEPDVPIIRNGKDKPSAKKGSHSLRLEIVSILSVALGVFIAVAMFSKAAGILGAYVKEILMALYGLPAYLVPIVIIVMSINFAVTRNYGKYGYRYWMVLFMLALVSAGWHMLKLETVAELGVGVTEAGQAGIGGGALGGALALVLNKFMGPIGGGIFLITVFLISIVVTFRVSIVQFIRGVFRFFRSIWEAEEWEDELVEEPSVEVMEEDEGRGWFGRKKEKKIKKKRVKVRKGKPGESPDDLPAASMDVAEEELDDDFVREFNKIKGLMDEDAEKGFSPAGDAPFDGAVRRISMGVEELRRSGSGQKAEAASTAGPAVAVMERTPDTAAELESVNGEVASMVIPAAVQSEVVEAPPEVHYELPSFNLLKVGKARNTTKENEKIAKTAKKLISTLASFGVEAKIVDYSVGPTVTRYELQPSVGVKISKIVGLADDIAMNLAAMGVRIEAPIPGKAAVGIEVPNESGATVNIREVIEGEEFEKFPSKTAFALGKDITGKTVVIDISRMPHLLIAGSTGSGKSVCINTLITSLLFKATPEEIKMILIDPKMVELGRYNGIPHLLIPVVTQPHKASGALQYAVKEMTERYKIFSECNVRDIKSYNAFAEKEEGRDIMPQIVIIIDELADLMAIAPHDVEDSISRLAALARAAGMYLVIATQRPSVDVITGVIKANVPSRISFAVSSQVDSRTILDMAGAEKLLGRGDMLYAPIGANKPVRIQGAFVSDKEVDHVVEYVKKQGQEVEYNQDMIEYVENYEPTGKGGKSSGGGKEKNEEDAVDPLLTQAIEMALEAGQASVIMYQRRLKIGYQRAFRIIEQMEARGIVGRHDGTKPRQILITRAEFHEMLSNAALEG